MPFTFKEFHDHCKKFKCEELVDFIIAIYNYQSAYESLQCCKQNITSEPEPEPEPGDTIKDRKTRLSIVQKIRKMSDKITGKAKERPMLREEVEIETLPNQTLGERNSSSNNIEQKLAYIINTYIRSTSPKQINIPFLINENLIKNYEGNMRGPILFKESLKHCEMILKTSPLPSFIIERRQNQPKLKD